MFWGEDRTWARSMSNVIVSVFNFNFSLKNLLGSPCHTSPGLSWKASWISVNRLVWKSGFLGNSYQIIMEGLLGASYQISLEGLLDTSYQFSLVPSSYLDFFYWLVLIYGKSTCKSQNSKVTNCYFWDNTSLSTNYKVYWCLKPINKRFCTYNHFVFQIQPSHQCIYIPYGGDEIKYREYEVLVLN